MPEFRNPMVGASGKSRGAVGAGAAGNTRIACRAPAALGA